MGRGWGAQAVLIERSVLVCKFGGSGGAEGGGLLELGGIWSYYRRKRALFHTTHAKSLTSRSPASHLCAAQRKHLKWF